MLNKQITLRRLLMRHHAIWRKRHGSIRMPTCISLTAERAGDARTAAAREGSRMTPRLLELRAAPVLEADRLKRGVFTWRQAVDRTWTEPHGTHLSAGARQGCDGLAILAAGYTVIMMARYPTLTSAPHLIRGQSCASICALWTTGECGLLAAHLEVTVITSIPTEATNCLESSSSSKSIRAFRGCIPSIGAITSPRAFMCFGHTADHSPPRLNAAERQQNLAATAL